MNLPRIHPKPTPAEWTDWLRISLERGAEWTFDDSLSSIAELSLKEFREIGKTWRVFLPTWESETNPLSLGRWLLKIFVYGLVAMVALIFFGQSLFMGLLLGGIYGGFILLLKTIFRMRKYPDDSRKEYLEICLKSKLFWTFCILWILNMIAIGYSFSVNLQNQFSYDTNLKEFGKTEIISKFHKSDKLIQALNAQRPDSDNPKIQWEEVDWKEYLFYVFFRSPWEQYSRLLDLTRVDWELFGNHIPRNSYDLIECNHTDSLYMDEPIRCNFFIKSSPDNRRVNQFNITETDPFHGEIVARILDGRRFGKNL
ncbi:MAG: hypothetical protein JJT78_15395 [Leptospira sp.]|nr:hypothetical protein [Leptospira sp.]